MKENRAQRILAALEDQGVTQMLIVDPKAEVLPPGLWAASTAPGLRYPGGLAQCRLWAGALGRVMGRGWEVGVSQSPLV